MVLPARFCLAARVCCDCCKHSYLVAFSCKGRGVCASCSAKRAVKFAEHLYDEVLEDVPYRHVVCSIPKRLRGYFRYDRRLLSILFDAAWGSIQSELAQSDGTPGFIATAQTAGEAINFNPHLHGMLSDGTWLSDGRFQPFKEINQEKLTEAFGTLVLSSLQDRGLIDSDTVDQIQSQEHTGFSVWVGESFQDKARELFVARYIERGPVSLEKLSIEHDIVTYTTKDGKCHEFDALEFLALLTAHIPNRSECITRYYGYHSCRARGERAKRQRAVSSVTELPEPKYKPSPTWAECIKRVYELDPLECPRCKSQMWIVAFINGHREIEQIIRLRARLRRDRLQSMGIPKAQAPPPIPNAIKESTCVMPSGAGNWVPNQAEV